MEMELMLIAGAVVIFITGITALTSTDSDGLLSAIALFWLFLVLAVLIPLGFLLSGLGSTGNSGKITLLLSLSIFAVFLSYVKHHWKLVYGIGEMAAALFGAYSAIAKPPADGTTRLSIMAGAVYILSRGINNVWDARTDSKERHQAATDPSKEPATT